MSQSEEQPEWHSLVVDALGVALSYIEPEEYAQREGPLAEAIMVYETVTHKRVVFLHERRARMAQTDPA